MEQLALYGHAIVALSATVLLGMILSPLSASRKSAVGLAPGCQPEADYSSSVYRWHRAYANLSETIGFFAAAILAAILAGVSPFLVNLLASVFFLSRLVLVIVHVKGMGQPNMSLRTMIYVIGWLMCVILAVLAILEVF